MKGLKPATVPAWKAFLYKSNSFIKHTSPHMYEAINM